MKKFLPCSLVLLLMVVEYGWIAAAHVALAAATRGGVAATKYYEKALEYEKGDELQLAVFYLNIASNREPENSLFFAKLVEIHKKSESRAQGYYRQGVSLLAQGSRQAAQKKFMKSLRCKAKQKNVVAKLKRIATSDIITTHLAVEHETFQTISAKYYLDPHLDFFIAYLNDLSRENPPPPGTHLEILHIDNKLKKELLILGQELSRAPQALSIEDRSESLKNAATGNQDFGKQAQSRALVNEALLRKATSLIDQKHYNEALATLEQIDNNYQEVGAQIARLKTRMRDEAEAYYKAGVRCFVMEQLVDAIEQWKKTLELYPEHPKAASDIEMAQSLLNRLKAIKTP